MINLRKYNFIGFDLDGTLINSSNAIMSCLEKTLPKYINDKSINLKRLMPLLYPLTINQYPKYLDFQNSQRFNEFKKDFSKSFDDVYFKKVRLLPYAVDVLKASVKHFGKKNIFILTNRRFESTMQICKYLGISDIVNTSKISSTVDDGTNNPKTKSLKDVLIRYRFHSKFGCYIGDSDSDVESAIENDLDSIKLHNFNSQETGTKYYKKYGNIELYTLSDLMELIQNDK